MDLSIESGHLSSSPILVPRYLTNMIREADRAEHGYLRD